MRRNHVPANPTTSGAVALQVFPTNPTCVNAIRCLAFLTFCLPHVTSEPATVGLIPAQALSQGHPGPAHWKCPHWGVTSGIDLLLPPPSERVDCAEQGSRKWLKGHRLAHSLTASFCLSDLRPGYLLQPCSHRWGLVAWRLLLTHSL